MFKILFENKQQNQTMTVQQREDRVVLFLLFQGFLRL